MQVNESFSLFKIRDIWHIQVCINYKRKTKSLVTKNKREAESRARLLYPLLKQLIYNGDIDSDVMPLKKLYKLWINKDHNWEQSTKNVNQRIIESYLRNGLPNHPTTRSIHIRIVNACLSWGTKQGYIIDRIKYKDTGSEPRDIILDDVSIIDSFINDEFRNLCYVLLDTGVRVQEIRQWEKTNQNFNKKEKWIRVTAKGRFHKGTKKRTVKLTERAADLISISTGFNYNHAKLRYWWEKNRPNKDIQVRDLRRTFAVSLYRKGVPMLNISRLMGHSSLAMTEWYLAPFKVDEIEI